MIMSRGGGAPVLPFSRLPGSYQCICPSFWLRVSKNVAPRGLRGIVLVISCIWGAALAGAGSCFTATGGGGCPLGWGLARRLLLARRNTLGLPGGVGSSSGSTPSHGNGPGEGLWLSGDMIQRKL